MQILTVDIGTGTQDILLFDSEREIENCFRLVMPSPTMVVAARIRCATAARQALLLTGTTMGGGPCHWAAMDHVRAGLSLYVTPEAARTFDDDLAAVREMGMQVIADDEAADISRVERVQLRDFWVDQIVEAFRQFGAEVRLDALAVAAFDHGAAPPGTSDRVFRFEYLRQRLSTGVGLAGFAFSRQDIPPEMTRLRAVADSAPSDLPMLVMDTAPAAVLGALQDTTVRDHPRAIIANVGNFHCLAFHLAEGRVAGLFEHHTGEVTAGELGRYIERLRDGTITNEEVYADKGHGALVFDPDAPAPAFVAATGPRRALLVESGLRPYLAVPHGDMMLAGNFGLLRAVAHHLPTARGAVERRLLH